MYYHINWSKRAILARKGNQKTTTITPELHPIPVKSPWHHIGVDFIGPVMTSTNFIPAFKFLSFILTLSDYCSKWVEAIPLPTKCASGTAGAIFKVTYIFTAVIVNFHFQIFMQMGIPQVLTTDCGSEFRNALDKELTKLLGIHHHLTTSYHPQV